MRAPAFWTADGLAARLLAPLGATAARLTARRLARPGWRAPIPVLCCGNATVGGTGKTTLALDLGERLRARGIAVHFLSRGHGGQAHAARRVDPARDDAATVGDEALLLASLAPTWVGRDRASSARAAIAAGAEALILDDGLQNPTLVPSAALLAIDGVFGFGNGRLLPAGPLREPVAAAAARAAAAVLIGPDEAGALALLPQSLPVLRADLRAGPEAAALAGRAVLGFAGIGRPAKFRATLAAAGVRIVGFHPFPDHHRYRERELARLRTDADRLGATLATTPKDAVRLPADFRAGLAVIGVRLVWQDAATLDQKLDQWLR